MLRIGICVGEASGDLLAAGLIDALRQDYPDLSLEGVGGPLLIARGCKSVFDMEKLAVMGFSAVLMRLPELINLRRQLIKHFIANPPDIFIGIDAPDFNLGIELALKQQGIKTIHYVSPSVWAWRPSRITKIAAATHDVLTLFPFETTFYQQHNVPATFVGHPLADSLPLIPDSAAARTHLQLPADKALVAMLPGSRKMELHFLAPVFLQTIIAVAKARPDIAVVIPLINKERREQFEQQLADCPLPVPIYLIDGQSQQVMAASDVILIASGTATLEAMLLKKPMVVAYKMSALNWLIAKWLVKIPYCSLPNLLANEPLVPEYLQGQATPERLSRAIVDWLAHPEKGQSLQQRFLDMHQALRCNASQRAAEAVKRLLTQ